MPDPREGGGREMERGGWDNAAGDAGGVGVPPATAWEQRRQASVAVSAAL